MDIKDVLTKMPFLTKCYMASLFMTAFTLSYLSQSLIGHLILDYTYVFKKLHLWRLITNVFVIGGFSTNFLFFLYFIFSTFQSYELAAIKTKRYAEFIAMLCYLLIIAHLVNLVSHYVFKFDVNYTLCRQIIFAMVYIDSKRNPLQPVIIFMFKLTNAYLPIAYLFLDIVTGGQIFESILGIMIGHIYYYLKDLFPIQNGRNVLPTPKFLVDFVEKKIAQSNSGSGASSNFTTLNNQNSSGSFGNRSTGNEGANNAFRRTNNNDDNRRFQPFSGTGHTIG